MNPQEQLRIEALRLALQYGADDPVAVAERFYAFLSGQPTKTPRQLIDAALEAADVR